MELARGVRVEGQRELVVPPELEASARQRVIALLRAWSRSLGNGMGEVLALLLLLVFYGWALVTTTFAVSEAHRFSFARGMMSMLTLAILCTVATGLLWYAIP